MYGHLGTRLFMAYQPKYVLYRKTLRLYASDRGHTKTGTLHIVLPCGSVKTNCHRIFTFGGAALRHRHIS